jgi:hypothetical protein
MTPMFMRIVVDFNFKPLGTHSYNIYMIIYIHLFIYVYANKMGIGFAWKHPEMPTRGHI